MSNPHIASHDLRDLIKDHDRIIMLGHGVPAGLINPKFKQTLDYGDLLIIDDSYADLLRDKETISIWCYSNRYFERHGIKGFHTGMIISEVQESMFVLGYCPLSSKQLSENMIRFAKIVGECIELPAQEMQQYILAHYQGDDAITKFNRDNILVLA